LEGAADGKPNALVFATGSGISPIRALLTSGALDGKSVRLYYGTANEEATAFLAESATWGCETVRVYSDGSGRHVQDALQEDIAKGLIDGANAFAVLCGQKEMTDDVKTILAGAGVDESAMVMNF
jgi:NAD(P)H-flavin reductase